MKTSKSMARKLLQNTRSQRAALILSQFCKSQLSIRRRAEERITGAQHTRIERRSFCKWDHK